MGWAEHKHSVWARNWRPNDKSTPTFFFLRSYPRHVHCLCSWILLTMYLMTYAMHVAAYKFVRLEIIYIIFYW